MRGYGFTVTRVPFDDFYSKALESSLLASLSQSGVPGREWNES